jgi:hypothetical protein
MALPKAMDTVGLNYVFALPRPYRGRIYFVESTYGSNLYSGLKYNEPLRSITYALTKCVDDNDDLIIVLNGYDNDNTDTETNGDDTPIEINKNGVSILFTGRNNIVQAIASGDSIFQINANQVTLGVLDKDHDAVWVKAAGAGTTSTVVEIKSAAVDAEVYGIRTQSLDGYDEVVTIAATAHRAYIHDCDFIGDATDTDEGIVIEGTTDQVRIENNRLVLCCTANGAIYSNSAHTNCLIRGNVIDSRTASKKGINFAGASATGMIISNRIYAAADANGCVNQNCAEYDNLVNDAFTTNAFVSPAAGTVT